MPNRPQFFFPTPPGYQDIPFVQPVPSPGSLLAGQYLLDYIVVLDNDAPQLFRSLFVEGVQDGLSANIQMRARDAYGNFITDGFVPLWLYAWGAGSTPPDGGSGRAKVFEPELFCPAGSVLILDFYNPG